MFSLLSKKRRRSTSPPPPKPFLTVRMPRLGGDADAAPVKRTRTGQSPERAVIADQVSHEEVSLGALPAQIQQLHDHNSELRELLNEYWELHGSLATHTKSLQRQSERGYDVNKCLCNANERASNRLREPDERLRTPSVGRQQGLKKVLCSSSSSGSGSSSTQSARGELRKTRFLGRLRSAGAPERPLALNKTRDNHWDAAWADDSEPDDEDHHTNNHSMEESEDELAIDSE